MASPKPYAREPLDGDIRFDPDDSRPIYIGMHEQSGAATTDTHWEILKITYATTTSYDATRIQKLSGAWNGRTGLGW